MKSNAARKLEIFKPRRVNIYAVKSHTPEWRYPNKPGPFEQWMLDWGYPILMLFGAPLITIAAIYGWLDSWLAPIFKALGV